MNRVYYPKLAWTNLIRNRRTYLPYSLACMCCMAMFYIMLAISKNIGINNMSGAVQIQTILNLGTVVIGIFSVIFLFYTNSFLMKRRKKEIGLYNILGMEKKHIAKILLYETVFVSLGCLILGLLSGILFSKLIFLLLLKMLSFKVPFVFTISITSLNLTVFLFLVIFILTLLSNLMHIRMAKPIELLKGGQVGEREPKIKWVMTILGILFLCIGYGIALFVKSPLMAISWFFIAALFVMFGTYALFTSGSIVLLKLLRKNKKFYYKINHFTSVSSMIYRMKQNAIGLSNICILSSAVLVMISTTVSLYVGVDDVLETRFPRDVMIQYDNASVENSQKLDQTLQDHVENESITMDQVIAYHYTTLTLTREEETFTTMEDLPYSSPNFNILKLITENDYNQMENKSVKLTSNEVLIYSNGQAYNQDEIIINGVPFQVKEEINTLQIEKKSPVVIINGYYIIVKDVETIRSIYENANEKKLENLNYVIGFNLKGEVAEKEIFVSNIRQKFKDQVDSKIYVKAKEMSRETFYGLYGGLLFLGLFLGILFLMATALIIYYKQISEGYDDQERYAIMQKVGMSRHEVKKTIKSQIMIVFFFPLLAAVIHIAVAFKMITRLLAVLNLVNIPLFFICTVGTILVFAIIYAGVYTLTARAYYRIVKW